MNIFGVLSMLGGLALFLYGMHTMGEGLTKISGGKLERILEKLTSSPLRAVCLGALVTAVIQSSSATTVMVVGFVNSGIMKLSQAIGIIMGANIGTTITSWILSLSGIESDNFLMQFLKPANFSPVLAIIGIFFIMFLNNQKKKDIGMILVGFAILMFGMETMSDAVAPLADVPEFTGILTMFRNPILGMLAGVILTAVIQSSSASVGILQALCATGAITYGTAFPIIMGQNIGTCVTALLSGVGATRSARRASLVHLYFNVLGTAVFMIGFYLVHAIVPFGFFDDVAGPMGIAVIHSVFNVVATLILLPFSKVLEKLAYISIPETEEEKQQKEMGTLLDERFLEQPAFAMERCKKVAMVMAETSKQGLLDAMSLIDHYDEKVARQVYRKEEEVDHFEDELGSYLVKLSAKNLSQQDAETLSMILHSISDFERISDHAMNIEESARKIKDHGIQFSDKAKGELAVFERIVKDILSLSVQAFVNENSLLARDIEPMEEVVDRMTKKVKKRHVKRLEKGKCTMEAGLVLNDLATNFERVADHCSNIGVCVIQINEDTFEAHEYLDTLDKGNNSWFHGKYEEYKKKYQLP
ncbi:MAG: Na/Pi cotransporter family protein [Clostridiales bacterium]|nr:Na/Pi cotransporter family protein [Eubacterium sp.]MDD7348770.1 Na/Pi cotransporter family protein [Clostridiales bacterium]MDY3774498.1 Na/Pi cotransporter family protein [Eubacterium sp.]